MMTFVIMQITVKFSFRFCCVRLVVVTFRGVVLVALVVPASVGSVIRPSSHTNPAKFVFALLTGHMIASLIFLNTRGALWTTFGVCQDPIGRFALIFTLFLPSTKFGAGRRRMRLFSASETEKRPALTFCHRCRKSCGCKGGRTFHGNFRATRTGTPTGRPIHFHKTSQLVLFKFRQKVRSQGTNFFLRQGLFTICLGARLTNT
mmetsp:Transcript_14026/g.20075  ORF Transcript_14026/g.20075 Transcript_14026/m.20075 type:complete len:204 (+) Transcript_14026:1431-2042(+)